MKVNKQDFLNIKHLLQNYSITEGKFINREIVKQLKLNGSVKDGKKTPKVRYIELQKEQNIFSLLKNYNYNISSIEDIDLYIEEIFDKKPPRDLIQKWHSDSKDKDSPSLKGLYISSLEEVDIKLNDEIVKIVPNNGLGYFLFHTEKIELFSDTIIIGIENYQVVWFAKKYQHFFQKDNILFVVINPYMLEWISDLANEYIHFGDFDLAGINIYLNKVVPRLKKTKKYSMFIPDNIEYLIEKSRNYKLYENQKQYEDLHTSDPQVNKLIEIIREKKKSIEQEGLYLL